VQARRGYVRRSDDIAADLRRRIQVGEFTRGLPSEARLAAEYETSRTTLRLAINTLDAQGLLVRRSGATHQVRVTPERTIVEVDLPGPGELTIDVATDEERARFGLPDGGLVVHVWDADRLDSDGNPTLWDVQPAIGARFILPGPGRPEPSPPAETS
jgi:DNA-binding transcriptional MocR family regulator